MSNIYIKYIYLLYNNNQKPKIMRTFITIENEKAEQFEQSLIEFNLIHDVKEVVERDFRTDFIFEDLSEEDEGTLEALKSELTFHF